MLRFILFISLFLLCTLNISAQKLNHSVGLYSVFSEHTPFWMQSNQFGEFDTEGSSLTGSLNSEFTQSFSERFSFSSELRLISRLSEHSTFYAPFINASIRYGRFHLTAGRFYNSRNQQLENLSTGSLTMSRNAVPIPRVLLTTEYISVPFTLDILQFKGSFGHGVMEDSRFVKRPFLHESSLYGKLGKEKLYLFLGLQRYAFWGGESKDPNVGKLPSSFSDLLRIVFSQEGGQMLPSWIGIINLVTSLVIMTVE